MHYENSSESGKQFNCTPLEKFLICFRVGVFVNNNLPCCTLSSLNNFLRQWFLSLLYFPLSIYDAESIVLGSNFVNGDLYEISCFEFPWIRKSHFWRLVCVTFTVWASVISIIQNQTTTGTPNFVFYICVTYRSFLKRFMKLEYIVFVQGHKNF